MLPTSGCTTATRAERPLAYRTAAAGLDELDSLQSTLNAAIDTIRAEIKVASLPPLNSLATEPHPFDLPDFVPSQKLYTAQTKAIASLGRLRILLQKPFARAVSDIYSVYDAASLDAAVKHGVFEALASTSKVATGLPIEELAQQIDVPSPKLIPILRILAMNGWVHEASEGIFAVTRAGLQLKRDTNTWNMIQTPNKPFVAAHLSALLSHPEWKHSSSARETAYQLAFNTNQTMFEHMYEKPEIQVMIQKSVQSFGLEYEAGILHDYPWDALDGRTIVDCGAGLGSLTLLIAPQVPNSPLVIQDLPGPLEIARAKLDTAFSEAERSRYTLQATDFFQEQPQTGPNCVYILKWVIHDWPDADAIKILSILANAGGKGAKILLIEFLVIPSSTAPHARGRINGVVANGLDVPAYIPSDFGEASSVVHKMSGHMLAACNSRERTLSEYAGIFERSGLVLSKCYKLRSPYWVLEADVL